jgi:NADPH:quinone reductase-like Zn-dependent oxidoreductase
MRAIISTPDGLGRVRLDDVPEPLPAPDEALVAVGAVSLNPGELALLRSRPAGWRPGQDLAGTVAVAARDGSGPAAGTRVVALVEQAGWAERVAVPVTRLATLPDTVTDAQAATLGIAGRTALRTVALGGHLLGGRVLITGGGAVGEFQLQLATAAGARVVAASRRPDAAKRLIAAGATDVVGAAGDAEGLFDLVLDTVGGRTLAAAVDKVAPGGTVVLIGVSDPEPAALTLSDFFGHENATIRAYFSYADQAPVDRDLATLAALVSDGRLTPPVSVQASWEAADEVLDALAGGRVHGKAVLTLAGPTGV